MDSSDVVRIDFHGGFLFRRLPDDWRSRAKGSGEVDGFEEAAAVSEIGAAGCAENGKLETAVEAAPSADEDRDGDTFFDAEEGGVCAAVEGDGGSILVSVQMYMDPKLSYVPTSLLNFVIRTVLYMMWCVLLRVAEGIRDDKMPDHQKAIAAKTSLYRWVEQRARSMLDRIFAPTPDETLIAR